MSKENFDKFINKKLSGAKKKEKIKQEKRAVKKEREAFFIEKKREMRAAKKLQQEAEAKESKTDSRNKYPKATAKPTFDNDKPAFGKDKPSGTNKADGKFSSDAAGKERAGEKKATSSYKANKEAFEKRQAQKDTGENLPILRSSGKKATPIAKTKPVEEQPASPKADKKAFTKEKDTTGRVKDGEKGFERKRIKKTTDPGLPYARKIGKLATPAGDGPARRPLDKPKKAFTANKAGTTEEGAEMPLNKFIAHGGVCSRRDAGELVKSGQVTVNGIVITEPGYKVQENDVVRANGKKVTNQTNLVYILLNKPKDVIATAEDPQGRKTVLDILKGATDQRIYPVGRLDRNTSGVLLLTNDGDLAQQLTHPSYEVRKIYEAKLDKPLAKADFDKLLNGIILEDGEIKADAVAYADSKDKSIIGIEIHSGRNRIVRRMFEALGYDVKGLDRVMFATLTKKNVERGKWRFLAEKEVRVLKFFNKSKGK